MGLQQHVKSKNNWNIFTLADPKILYGTSIGLQTLFVQEWRIGDQLGLILPISGGRS